MQTVCLAQIVKTRLNWSKVAVRASLRRVSVGMHRQIDPCGALIWIGAEGIGQTQDTTKVQNKSSISAPTAKQPKSRNGQKDIQGYSFKIIDLKL